jgi:PAS domain S-box-containing protein
MIMGNDIAEQKRVEDALQVSEIRYRRLFETAQDGILLLDADSGQITDVNPFLTDLIGCSKEELLNKRLWDIGFFKDINKSRNIFLELKNQTACGHPTLKDGVCFGPHAHMPARPVIWEFRNRRVFVAQVLLICTIETLLSVSLEIP